MGEESSAPALDENAVLVITEEGERELHEAGTALGPADLEVLVLIGGHATLGEVTRRALKAARATLRDLFFANMSGGAAKLLREDMQAMGPVRLRDVEEAQGYLVSLAKDLAASGEIVIADSKGDDELVY